MPSSTGGSQRGARLCAKSRVALSDMVTVVPEIRMPGGLVVVVDDVDFARVSAFKWHAHRRKKLIYAMRRFWLPDGRKGAVLMHRFILGVPRDIEVDHRNGDGLDNCRSNLRPCSNIENGRNKRAFGRLGLKGVYEKPNGRFVAGILRIHLGTFDSAAEAARAYDAAAIIEFGEFAKLNFPNSPKPQRRHEANPP